jgi:phosphoadenosine phosphosulfate reductase
VLLASPRYTAEDAARWAALERQDAVYAGTARFARHVARAERWLSGFVREREARCYAGVSWGKDSTVIADMVCRLAPTVSLVWVRVEPIANPDCVLVRDAFFAIHSSARYEEIVVRCERDPQGLRVTETLGDLPHAFRVTGTLERGFAEAAHRFGSRHISGVRAEESGARRRRMEAFGAATDSTCAPIGWWRAEDVWAYLYARHLPVHPAYACMGVAWSRDRIRVASMGGRRGRGHGRQEWERRYYPEARRL